MPEQLLNKLTLLFVIKLDPSAELWPAGVWSPQGIELSGHVYATSSNLAVNDPTDNPELIVLFKEFIAQLQDTGERFTFTTVDGPHLAGHMAQPTIIIGTIEELPGTNAKFIK